MFRLIQKIMNKGIQKDSRVSWGSLLVLLLWAVSLFLFALLSGTDSYGSTFREIIANAPNALPWLIPIILSYVTWRRQVLGGTLFILFGLATILFFATYDSIAAFLVVSLPAILLGAVLVIVKVRVKSVKMAGRLPVQH